jgi:hydroxyacylglutathione hydrolase
LLELPDYVVVLPSHYGGSVCGRGLSGNPMSSIGFERLHNRALQHARAQEFADELLRDLPEAPSDQARIVAANRRGAAVPASAGGGDQRM